MHETFATKEDTRRHEHLLILWLPPHTDADENAYAALKELLTDVRVHLTTRRPDHLAYPRLVALAG